MVLDFSQVISREIAEELFAEGALEKSLLFPGEFGGEDRPENQVYLPLGIGNLKNESTETIASWVDDGLIEHLTVTPEYRGKSVVPCRIHLTGTHPDRLGSLGYTIEIW